MVVCVYQNFTLTLEVTDVTERHVVVTALTVKSSHLSTTYTAESKLPRQILHKAPLNETCFLLWDSFGRMSVMIRTCPEPSKSQVEFNIYFITADDKHVIRFTRFFNYSADAWADTNVSKLFAKDTVIYQLLRDTLDSANRNYPVPGSAVEHVN